MHMVTRLSRKVVVVMVFRKDWAAEVGGDADRVRRSRTRQI